MLDEVHDHQDAGRATFIVSAAGVELVEMLAWVLGMDGGIGTRYEIDDDGRFTGELDGPFIYGKGKVEAMSRFAADHGIDLAESYAYSDAASDLPMLRAVGNPVAVNPDEELAPIAQPRGVAGDALREARPPAGDRRRPPSRRRRSGTLLASRRRNRLAASGRAARIRR